MHKLNFSLTIIVITIKHAIYKFFLIGYHSDKIK